MDVFDHGAKGPEREMEGWVVSVTPDFHSDYWIIAIILTFGYNNNGNILDIKTTWSGLEKG